MPLLQDNTAILKLYDASKLTQAESWFMGNGFRYEASPDDPLTFKLMSQIPGFAETMVEYFSANYIPFALYDESGNLIEHATYYPRAYLRTPAARLIANKLAFV